MPEIQFSQSNHCPHKRAMLLFASMSHPFACVYLGLYLFPCVKPSGPHQASSEPQFILCGLSILVATSPNSAMFMKFSWG